MGLSDMIFIAVVAAAWLIGVLLLGLAAAKAGRRNWRSGRVLARYESIGRDGSRG